MSLLLHCGAQRAEIGEVFDVPTPEPEYRGAERQRLFVPIPHKYLYNHVRNTLERAGLRIHSEAHALQRDGARYFGLLSVGADSANERANWGMAVGLRNAHDGTSSAALALGSHVFVCDNLCFDGEVKLSRAHTRYIQIELPGMVARAVGRLFRARGAQRERLDRYQSTEITDQTAKAAILDGLLARAIPNRKVKDVLGDWLEPRHEEFSARRNVWRLFNAFTENFKPADGRGAQLAELPVRSAALYSVLDPLAGVTLN